MAQLRPNHKTPATRDSLHRLIDHAWDSGCRADGTFVEPSGRNRRQPVANTNRRASVSAVLVTGGTGRLGTHAVRLLQARGHQVRVLSRRIGGDLRRNLGVREAAAGVEFVLHARGVQKRGRRFRGHGGRGLLMSR